MFFIKNETSESSVRFIFIQTDKAVHLKIIYAAFLPFDTGVKTQPAC